MTKGIKVFGGPLPEQTEVFSGTLTERSEVFGARRTPLTLPRKADTSGEDTCLGGSAGLEPRRKRVRERDSAPAPARARLTGREREQRVKLAGRSVVFRQSRSLPLLLFPFGQKRVEYPPKYKDKPSGGR